MSDVFKKLAKAFMPNIVEAGIQTFFDDVRRKASRGEVDPEWLLMLAKMLRGFADELETMAGRDDLMSKIRRAKGINIKEEK